MSKPSTGAGASLQEQQKALMEKFRDMQSGLQELMLKQQQLEAQMNENNMVKMEFEKLAEDDEVHKQVGPVLVKVPVSDAKAAVENRLRFIEEQVKSVERQIEAKTAEQDAQREKIIEFQKANAAAIAGAAAGGEQKEQEA